jgi:hypothetical protein
MSEQLQRQEQQPVFNELEEIRQYLQKKYGGSVSITIDIQKHQNHPEGMVNYPLEEAETLGDKIYYEANEQQSHFLEVGWWPCEENIYPLYQLAGEFLTVNIRAHNPNGTKDWR